MMVVGGYDPDEGETRSEAELVQEARERTFKDAHEKGVRANPLYHRCGVGEVDFTKALKGEVSCKVCGAKWSLTDRGWNRSPRPINVNRGGRQ